MSDRRALELAVLDDIDEAPIAQLGDRQARHRVDDVLVLHRLRKGTQLRKELKARLRLLAIVDVAADDRDRLELAVRAVDRTHVLLPPTAPVGAGKNELFGDGVATNHAHETILDVVAELLVIDDVDD